MSGRKKKRTEETPQGEPQVEIHDNDLNEKAQPPAIDEQPATKKAKTTASQKPIDETATTTAPTTTTTDATPSTAVSSDPPVKKKSKREEEMDYKRKLHPDYVDGLKATVKKNAVDGTGVSVKFTPEENEYAIKFTPPPMKIRWENYGEGLGTAIDQAKHDRKNMLLYVAVGAPEEVQKAQELLRIKQAHLPESERLPTLESRQIEFIKMFEAAEDKLLLKMWNEKTFRPNLKKTLYAKARKELSEKQNVKASEISEKEYKEKAFEYFLESASFVTPRAKEGEPAIADTEKIVKLSHYVWSPIENAETTGKKHKPQIVTGSFKDPKKRAIFEETCKDFNYNPVKVFSAKGNKASRMINQWTTKEERQMRIDKKLPLQVEADLSLCLYKSGDLVLVDISISGYGQDDKKDSNAYGLKATFDALQFVHQCPYEEHQRQAVTEPGADQEFDISKAMPPKPTPTVSAAPELPDSNLAAKFKKQPAKLVKDISVDGKEEKKQEGEDNDMIEVEEEDEERAAAKV